MSMFGGGGNQQGAGQQNNQQGQQQNGQQQGTNDAGQSQQGQAAGGDGSLIAAAADGAVQQGQGDGGQAGQQGGGQQQGQDVTLESLAAQLGSLQQTFTSQLDQRINQVTGTLRREFGQRGQGQQQDQGQQGGDAGQQGQGRAAGQPVGPDQADVREARSVARDALNDGGFRFVDPAERQLAMSMVNNEVAQRLAAGADPDTAGAQAATAAVAELKKLRGAYESATLAALRTQGRLVEAPGTQQRVAGMPLVAGAVTGQPNAVGAFQQGQADAARLLPGRVRQAQGQQQ